MQAANDANRHIRFWGWTLAILLYSLLAVGFVMVDMRDVRHEITQEVLSDVEAVVSPASSTVALPLPPPAPQGELAGTAPATH